MQTRRSRPTPSVPDHEKYAADGHPHPPGGAPVPAAGYQSHISTRESYQPPPYIASSVRSQGYAEQWSTGLCHCCNDPPNCLITAFCPCITFGQIAEIVNKGSWTCATHGTIYGLLILTGYPCLYSCFYRSKLRGQYDLPEAPCVDCLVHFCCEPCALCQEYRELKERGYDMGIGWEANMDRQRRGVTIAPGVAQSMTR